MPYHIWLVCDRRKLISMTKDKLYIYIGQTNVFYIVAEKYSFLCEHAYGFYWVGWS